MKLTARKSTVVYWSFAAILMIIAGCGRGGGGPTAPPPGVPVISNLAATFHNSCTLQGRTGTSLTETVDYSDSDGDVRGGTLETTGTFHPSGQSIDLNFGLPSSSATITGTTSGTIQAFACVTFGTGTTGFTLSVAALDTAGHSSNILSIEVSRPAEAPRVPGVGETGGGTMERLRP